MNTGIPGLDPLRDFTEKPSTEIVETIQDKRVWEAKWIRMCRKAWREGKILACSIVGREGIKNLPWNKPKDDGVRL